MSFSDCEALSSAIVIVCSCDVILNLILWHMGGMIIDGLLRLLLAFSTGGFGFSIPRKLCRVLDCFGNV